jgi:hypothetical protein
MARPQGTYELKALMKELSRPVAAPATPYHHSAFGFDAGHDH